MKNADTYQIIIDQVLSLLEAGTAPWRAGWLGADQRPHNAASGHVYRGINVFMLAAMRIFRGYSSPQWLTYRQARTLGGYVRKGEKGTPILFFRVVERESEGGRDGNETFALARHSRVFNRDQCEELPPPHRDVEVAAEPGTNDACEAVIAGYADCPPILEGDAGPAYRPLIDQIVMPRRSQFTSTEEWYATLFHEAAHSTGHAKRLARPAVCDVAAFGSHSYGMEELVAEMTAALLCGDCGIAPAVLTNQAAYIQGWLRAIREEPRAVIQAASLAQKAADYIGGAE